jgi:Transposase
LAAQFLLAGLGSPTGKQMRKESRKDLPWPVAPIPSVPAFSNAMKVADVVQQLNGWHAELEHWLHIWRKRDTTFFRRLPRIEQQIRLLLQRAEEGLSDDVHKTHRVKKRSTLAQYHELLARCLGSFQHDEGKDEQAVLEFRTAMSLAPEVSDYWYSYVRHLVLRGRVCQALDEINAVDVRLIETENESIAHQIVNWALAHPEIAFGIRSDLIKCCIALVSQRRSGLLVIGNPLPRASGEKWQRSEILRILWAGMQCSVPVDELCKREGIDEATYYRWRKRYLPAEWGTDPALA